MNKLLLLLLTLCLAGLTACDLEPVKPTTSAEDNFEYLWREFDQRYGAFEAKQVNWAATYQHYRPQLTARSGPDDLYRVLTQMLDGLNDYHVSLTPTDGQHARFVSGASRGPVLNHTSLALIQSHYLTEVHVATPELVYGKLPGNVGYIYLKGFDDNFSNYERNFDTILAALKDTKGLVIDLRDNWGGRDELAQYVAGRFADESRLYMKSRKRNGPGHQDFTPWQEWYLRPTGTAQYRHPIILLTSDDTISAGETFALAMKRLPYVRQVGLPTAGAFSDRVERDLPNGWRFTVAVGDYRDHTGQNRENRGLTPDVPIANTTADLANNQDPMLQRALQLAR